MFKVAALILATLVTSAHADALQRCGAQLGQFVIQSDQLADRIEQLIKERDVLKKEVEDLKKKPEDKK